MSAAPEQDLPGTAAVLHRWARLSGRERQVMEGVLAGLPNRDIATRLGISPRTVEVFKARMMVKMQARNVPELARMWQAVGRAGLG